MARYGGYIYPLSDSAWVSPEDVVPKKGGTTVIKTEDNTLLPFRTITGWRICIDYRKLNKATRKDHFPLPYLDQMLDRCFILISVPNSIPKRRNYGCLAL